MPKIPSGLIERLRNKLDLTQPGVYARISSVSKKHHLSTRHAAIKLAMDVGIGYKRFATDDDLRAIRGLPQNGGFVPIAPTPAPAKRAGNGRQLPKRKPVARAAAANNNKTVFVVHGRDEKIRANMFDLLRALGLQPLEWAKARSLTKKPNPQIEEILDTAFKNAQAVVVLFTPDELVKQKDKFIRSSDPHHEKNEAQQARPNVLFECGIVMGRSPDRTVLLEIGPVRPFSDLAGRHMLRFDGKAASLQEFAARLKSAGCKVDQSGSDWIHERDFSV